MESDWYTILDGSLSLLTLANSVISSPEINKNQTKLSSYLSQIHTVDLNFTLFKIIAGAISALEFTSIF